MKRINYDRIPHEMLVYDLYTGEVWQIFAKDHDDAIKLVQRDYGAVPPSDVRVNPFRVKELLTPEGYRIMRLKDIPLGDYFSFVQSEGDKKTADTVWVRSEYDRSAKKYEIYKFADVNDCRLRRGTARVTCDITF